MTIILYRAMCEEEAKKSIEDQRPNFIRRYKGFSPSLDFVTRRIQDGKFNNSQFRPERYTNILTFEFSERAKDYFTKVGNKELMIDRRKFPLIGVISVRKINNEKYKEER